MLPSKLTCMILCLLMTRIQNVYGLRCMECSDLPTPVDCDKITTCGQSEQCYVDQYITSSGIVLYSSGCRSQFRCAAPSGKKRFLMSSTDILTCSQCCNNAEFCNIEGCGIRAPQIPQRGLFCFQCDAQSRPDTCRDIVMCDVGNACVVSKIVTGPQIYYQTNCVEEKACESIDKIAAIVGRRRQTLEQCPVCCRTDFCNDNCDRNITVSNLLSPLTTTSIVPSTARSTTIAGYLTTDSSQTTSLSNSFTSRPTGKNTIKSSQATALNSTVSSTKTSGYLPTISSHVDLSTSAVPSQTTGQVTIKSSQTPALNSTVGSTKTSGYFTTISSRTVNSATTSKTTGQVSTNSSPNPSLNSTVGFTKTPGYLTTKYSQFVTSKSAGHVTIKSSQAPTSKKTAHSTITGVYSSTKGLHISTPKSTSTTSPSSFRSSVSSASHPSTHIYAQSHWAEWTHWSNCNCHDITQTRHRHCVRVHHQNCHGIKDEHKPCSDFSKCHGPTSHMCNTTAGYALKHIQHSNFCIKLYWKAMTWEHAQQQCKKDDPNGHLVVINTPDREKALEEYLYHMHGHTSLSTLWIGLNFWNGHWHWSNGAHIYGNYYTQNFFNTHRHPSLHCAGKLASGGWSTFSCYEEHSFVCEIR